MIILMETKYNNFDRTLSVDMCDKNRKLSSFTIKNLKELCPQKRLLTEVV